MDKKLFKASLYTLIGLMSFGVMVGCGSNQGGNPSENEKEKFTFTAKDTDKYYFVFNSGSAGMKDGVVEVNKGTIVSFVVFSKETNTQPDLIVKANGVALDRNVDWSYDVTVNEDVTITIEEKDVPVYYTVSFTPGDSYSYTDLSVSLTNNTASVLKDTTVSFRVEVKDGYDGTDLTVRANGRQVGAVDDVYSYQVTENVTFTVEGIVQETTKYNVTFVEGTGYHYESVSQALDEGKCVVNEGTDVAFIVAIDTGFDGSNAVVKANGEAITLDEDDEHYHAVINGDTTITVDGVETAKCAVTLRDTDAYEFVNVEGVSLTDGVGVVEYNATIKFSIDAKPGYEKIDTFKVTANGVELTDVEGVYTVSVTEDVSVAVTGVARGFSVVADSAIVHTGTASDDINAEGGYTKSTQYEGAWGPANYRSFASVTLSQYTEVKFAVKCSNGKYFELIKTGEAASTYSEFAYNGASWCEYKFVKENIAALGEDPVYVYRCYKNSTWTRLYLDYEDDLNVLSAQLGDDGLFLFSELVGRKDDNYKVPQHEVTFIEEGNHHTLEVLNRDAAPYKFETGEEVKFKVTMESPYFSLVKVNGVATYPNAEGVYSFICGKANIVTITDLNKVATAPFQGINDNGNGSYSSNTFSWSKKIAMVDVDNLENYSSLFFEMSFSQKSYFDFDVAGVGTKGGMHTCSTGVSYTVTLTKGAENKWTITVTGGLTDFPTAGKELVAAEGKLSNLSFYLNDGVVTFSPLFGNLA